MPLLKLAALLREGSGSMVGIPVADVVVVHVLVDIRRRRLGATKRFPRCKGPEKKKITIGCQGNMLTSKLGRTRFQFPPASIRLLAVQGTKQCSRIG